MESPVGPPLLVGTKSPTRTGRGRSSGAVGRTTPTVRDVRDPSEERPRGETKRDSPGVGRAGLGRDGERERVERRARKTRSKEVKVYSSCCTRCRVVAYRIVVRVPCTTRKSVTSVGGHRKGPEAEFGAPPCYPRLGEGPLESRLSNTHDPRRRDFLPSDHEDHGPRGSDPGTPLGTSMGPRVRKVGGVFRVPLPRQSRGRSAPSLRGPPGSHLLFV